MPLRGPQTLELYLNIVGALCKGTEFRGQVDSHNMAGGIATAALGALNKRVDGMAKPQDFLTASRARVEK